MSSTVDILAKLAPDLSHDELDGICRLSIAIHHALACVADLPKTLDDAAVFVLACKLKEADHWCLELTRIAAK